MSSNCPKVSVVMPIYHSNEYLAEAIDSILSQTFKDFEFILICDDPTFEVRQILDRYKQLDSRVTVYYQDRQGLINSLNRGCTLAKGEYIARMDADDISLPKRFEKQVFFLDNNTDICIVGTDIELIDYVGKPFQEYLPPTLPTDPRVIQWSLMFYCCIHHPTVMFRKSLYLSSGGYSKEFIHAEDYEFWLRISSTVNFANLPEKLVYIRKHMSNITNFHRQIQQKNADIAAQTSISNLLKREIPLSTIQIMRNPSIAINRKSSFQSAELLVNVYKEYFRVVKLNRYQRQHIKRDVARRMITFTKRTGFNGIVYLFPIWIWASCINPITTLKIIIRTGKKILKRKIENYNMQKLEYN